MKKIISAILAIAMCISMFAGITVSAAATTTEKEYIFGWNSDVTGGIVKNSIPLVTNTKYTIDHPLVQEVISVYTKNSGDTTGFPVGYSKNCLVGLDDYGTHGWKYFDVNDYTDAFWATTGNIQMAYIDGEKMKMRNAKYNPIYPEETKLGIELEVPSEPGYYIVSSKINKTGMDLYAGRKETDKTTVEEYMDKDHNFIAGSGKTSSASGNYVSYPTKLVYNDGKTPIIFVIHHSKNISEANVYSLKLAKAEISGTPIVTKGATELAKGEKTTASVSAGDATVLSGTITWESSNTAAVTVENGVIEAVGYGESVISAKAGDETIDSWTITVPAPEDEELTDAFDDAVIGSVPNDYIAPSVDAIDADGIVGEPVPVSGGAYKITAPETNDDGEAFLYWKKAMTVNEKIVSFEREFNYVPESKGRNILVAVYEGDISSTAPKCYNANGQYLPDAQPIDADLPSMAGYSKAYEWKQYGNTNVYVAQYSAETPIAGINVYIARGSGDNENAAYGELITCTVTDSHKEKYGAYFKYWMRIDTDGTETIVSRDEEYSFRAWESCTITGEYSKDPVTYNGPTIKILIDSFDAGDETGVMAEFLGFGDNVVEKGIMFNGNRIAMTTVGNQFSVIADKAGTYVGYAIVRESDGLKLITDGSFIQK